MKRSKPSKKTEERPREENKLSKAEMMQKEKLNSLYDKISNMDQRVNSTMDNQAQGIDEKLNRMMSSLSSGKNKGSDTKKGEGNKKVRFLDEDNY
jgi:CRISPR/Cas system CSM-associated protein Csm2 small subunit